MVTSTERELLTVEDAASKTGVPEWQLRYWLRRGYLTRHKRAIDNRVFIDAAELARKLEVRPEPKAGE